MLKRLIAAIFRHFRLRSRTEVCGDWEVVQYNFEVDWFVKVGKDTPLVKSRREIRAAERQMLREP